MSASQSTLSVAERVRALAEMFVQTDLLRLKIERDDEEIELARRSLHPDQLPEMPASFDALETPPVRADLIKADLVGIFHLTRPTAAEGDLLESDRELAYIEALGIRNPVRSLGAGRILGIKKADGDPVEYGAVLFEIDRG